MYRHLPSLRSLLVFDAVARHRSVSRAAEALCLTHSALSQQLRQLESRLGVRLLQRSSRGTELTEAGRRYHAQIAADLLRLENHTLEAMAQRPDGGGLLVGAVPGLAERWLMPRLPGFLARHPGCQLHLQVFPTQRLLDAPAFDIGLQYEDAVWPEARSLALMPERTVVVCAPSAVDRVALGRGDFRNARLLQLASRLDAWAPWFEQAGIRRLPLNSLGGHRFDLFSALLEGVRADLGIGLVPHFLVARELAAGELVLAHPHEGCSKRGYAIYLDPQRQHDPLVQAFADWLLEVAQDPV